MYTVRGIKQILYGCAGAIEASVKEIRLQLNETGAINIIDEQTIPMQWYIEKENLSIAVINPWRGGVKFKENIPKNSKIVRRIAFGYQQELLSFLDSLLMQIVLVLLI